MGGEKGEGVSVKRGSWPFNRDGSEERRGKKNEPGRSGAGRELQLRRRVNTPSFRMGGEKASREKKGRSS